LLIEPGDHCSIGSVAHQGGEHVRVEDDHLSN
jgi:hypothetical protein